MERAIERSLWDLLVARLGDGHRLLVAGPDDIAVEDVPDLKSGALAGLERLRQDAEQRAFLGRTYDGRPVLLELVGGQLHDVQPLSARRSRLSPLAGEA